MVVAVSIILMEQWIRDKCNEVLFVTPCEGITDMVNSYYVDCRVFLIITRAFYSLSFSVFSRFDVRIEEL